MEQTQEEKGFSVQSPKNTLGWEPPNQWGGSVDATTPSVLLFAVYKALSHTSPHLNPTAGSLKMRFSPPKGEKPEADGLF